MKILLQYFFQVQDNICISNHNLKNIYKYFHTNKNKTK